MYFFTSFATAVLALTAFTLAGAISQPAHYREYVDTVKPSPSLPSTETT